MFSAPFSVQIFKRSRSGADVRFYDFDSYEDAKMAFNLALAVANWRNVRYISLYDLRAKRGGDMLEHASYATKQAEVIKEYEG